MNNDSNISFDNEKTVLQPTITDNYKNSEEFTLTEKELLDIVNHNFNRSKYRSLNSDQSIILKFKTDIFKKYAYKGEKEIKKHFLKKRWTRFQNLYDLLTQSIPNGADKENTDKYLIKKTDEIHMRIDEGNKLGYSLQQINNRQTFWERNCCC